jgi:pimeloyl-ACP methyl ester carboxylesterase
MLTERYKAAEKVLKANPHIKTVVGHSYGATTAYALTRNYRVKGRAYGSPVARVFNDARFQSFRHSGDPVSILDFAAKTSKRPFKGPLDAHSYKFHDGIYKSRSSFLDHDDL